jgi:hypothetical protein
MDLLKMIAELQTEKQRLDEAILALERLSTSNARHRGRPTRWPKVERHSSASVLAEEAQEENEPSIKEG